MKNVIVNKFKNGLSNYAVNMVGRKTDSKIVAFESDDWGAIRMASTEVYEFFKKKGYGVGTCAFNKFDTLETSDDINKLIEALSSVKDQNGRGAVFTLNQIVGNPDFKKIESSGFNQYFVERVDATYKRLNRENVLNTLKDGVDQMVFDIQFHGREHVDVFRWMTALRNNNSLAREAFNFEMYSVRKSEPSNARKEFLETYSHSGKEELEFFDTAIKEGVHFFRNLWGRSPESFIAPCYVWPIELEQSLARYGIKYIQSAFVQKIPDPTKKLGFKKKRHFQGEVNILNQTYTIRNVLFEPSTDKTRDWLNTALDEVSIAFKLKKPAIVSSHRLNYVGGLSSSNRDRNLEMLHEFLTELLKRYPDIIFMKSTEVVNQLK